MHISPPPPPCLPVPLPRAPPPTRPAHPLTDSTAQQKLRPTDSLHTSPPPPPRSPPAASQLVKHHHPPKTPPASECQGLCACCRAWLCVCVCDGWPKLEHRTRTQHGEGGEHRRVLSRLHAQYLPTTSAHAHAVACASPAAGDCAAKDRQKGRTLALREKEIAHSFPLVEPCCFRCRIALRVVTISSQENSFSLSAVNSEHAATRGNHYVHATCFGRVSVRSATRKPKAVCHEIFPGILAGPDGSMIRPGHQPVSIPRDDHWITNNV